MRTNPQPTRSPLSPEHQQLFLQMLPGIRRFARQRFAQLDPESKEEATAETVAAAFLMFVHLARAGRESLAYPTVLARYGVRRYRSGRKAAGSQSSRDVMSRACRLANGVTVERLDRPSVDGKSWEEIVVEDRNAGPAEVAATRMDFSAWLQSLSKRDRKIAELLATGESTGRTAKKFGVSAARVSQLRRQLKRSWERFVGELPVVPPAAVAA